MATFLSCNFALTNLASAITSSQTTVEVTTGTGQLFPTPSAGQFFTLTLNDALTGLLYEVCYCTSRTGDSLTVTRGQEGTTARAWSIGDFAYRALTASEEQILQQANMLNPETFTSSATVVVPNYCSTAWVQGGAGGAGGAGGGGATDILGVGAGGAGGGAGQSTPWKALAVVPGETLTISLGAGGAGGAGGTPTASGNSGAAGGNTTITGSVSGLLLTLAGGSISGGGVSFTSSGTIPSGGPAGGGYPSGSDGNDGASGFNGGVGNGGMGASSPFGGGGGSGRAGSSGSGAFNGGGYGSGGGGGGGGYGSSSSGSNGGQGGNGAPGIIMLFFQRN